MLQLWNVICWLAIGALIGWAASKIMKSKGGLLRNMITGIVGSSLGGWLGSQIGISSSGPLSLVGMLVSIGGACLLIFLCRLIVGKR